MNTFSTAAGGVAVDQVVTARGVVVAQSPTVLVQPLETAIVHAIDVREGQQVQVGQVLARHDPTFAAADVAALEPRDDRGANTAVAVSLPSRAESGKFAPSVFRVG